MEARQEDEASNMASVVSNVAERKDSNDFEPKLHDTKSDQDSEDQFQAISNEKLPGKDEEKSDEEENSEWFDLLNNKDILKKTLVAGPEASVRPVRGSQCVVQLSTRNADTEEVIASETFESLQVIVGEYDLIHGLDLSLPLMHLGEEAQILIKPRFGYGLKGKQPDIPSNCRLDCRLKLVSIQEPEQIEEEEEEKLIYLAKRKKERGNFWFGREEYSSAIVNYKRCIDFVEIVENRLASDQDLDDEKQEGGGEERVAKQRREWKMSENVLQLKSTAHNNLALAFIKTESYNMALESVEAALQLTPENVKALFRKATALKSKGEVADAVLVLQHAIQLQPNNREVISFHDELRKQKQKEFQNEKQLYRRMLRSNSDAEGEDMQEDLTCCEKESDNIGDEQSMSQERSSKANMLCKTVQSYFSNKNHLNLVLAGSCFLTAFLSWLGYFLIFQ